MAAMLMGAWSLQSCDNGPTKEVWLDEFGQDSCYVQDWGMLEVNRSVVHTPLTVNGVVYERGLGAHSISRLLYDLDGKAVSISGLAGADDKNLFAGKLQFKILGDKKELWKSGVMQKGDPVKEFNVNLKGVDKVLLLVEECGDGIMYDHADWLNVKITTRGDVKPVPAWAKPVAKEKYILTPPAPESPVINNPLVYGARPGNPFLWSVMATGNRPMKFEAEGLPAGVKLDAVTGRITGKATVEGEYKVTLKATNDKGTAQKEVTVKIGDAIALTPSMGWNSWNCWGLSVNDEKVRDAARMMNEKLHAYGWEYVNIDDGWEAASRTKQGEILSNDKFPDFKALTDYIHGLGLKFGIYSSPGHITCGGHVGSYQHEEIDAKTWERWGVDYLKYDYCGYLEIEKDSEEKTIQELKKQQKPFIVLVNSQMPYKDAALKTAEEIQQKYKVTALTVNCDQLRKEDIARILEKVLYEFPVSQIQFFIPRWVEMLPLEHELKQQILSQIRDKMKSMQHIRDITKESVKLSGPYVQDSLLEDVGLSDGTVKVRIRIKEEYYYRMLSQMSGIEMESEYELIHTMQELVHMKEEYVKVQAALEAVRGTGYGVVVPNLDEIEIAQPEVIRQGNKYGVKIKSKSPSIHMIKANIETEIAPIVGTEQQAKDLIQYIDEGSQRGESIWETNIFGKSIEQLVQDGIRSKIAAISEESQVKLQDTMQKIVNDSKGGLVCIII